MQQSNLVNLSEKLIFLILLCCMLTLTGEIRASQKTQKGWLGVSIKEMTPSMIEDYKLGDRSGLLITDVVHNSPADDAGLWEDDVIVEFDGKAVAKAKEFSKMVRKITPGTAIKLKIVRDGEEKSMTVEIGKRKRKWNTLRRIDESFLIISGRPRLGVQIEDLNSDLAPYFKVEENSGVLIWEVFEDSPAETAGLKAGDVLTKIDGEKISDSEDLVDALEDYEGGDVIKIEYVRKGKSAEVEVELDDDEHQNIHIGIPPIPRLKIEQYKKQRIEEPLLKLKKLREYSKVI